MNSDDLIDMSLEESLEHEYLEDDSEIHIEQNQQILTFPINVSAVMSHLKQDMKDDWFSDVLKYEDLFAKHDALLSAINDNLNHGNGQYHAGQKQIYDIPKASYGLRYALEFDFYDRFLYQAICSYLIKFYDPLLSHRVLSHRFNKNRKNERYIFKNRIELWQTFEGITRLGIENSNALLATDLINYFEHISIRNIEDSLIELLPRVEASGSEKTKIRNAIHTLTTLLKKWCFNEYHGLPQNRDASSFIANVVLYKIDARMEELSYDYFRYVDDIRIICKNELHAKKALNDLIIELRKVGMNINSKKTAILTGATDKSKIIDYFPGYDERSIAIDNMWKSRNRKIITRSIPLLVDILHDLVEKKDTQSRQFRFCINRFKALISSNLFDTKSILASTVAETIIDALEDQPASTDQFCKMLSGLDLSESHLLAIENFLLKPELSIFSWQNFNLWLLLASKKHFSSNLLDLCSKKFEDDLFQSEIPACFIYLAANGKRDEVEKLIPKFRDDWPYQHQRFFLISLQESDKTTIKPIIASLTAKTRGTISRIRKSKALAGVYVRENEPTSIERIYDEMGPYD